MMGVWVMVYGLGVWVMVYGLDDECVHDLMMGVLMI